VTAAHCSDILCDVEREVVHIDPEVVERCISDAVSVSSGLEMWECGLCPALDCGYTCAMSSTVPDDHNLSS
jgi:hypothetical protein